MTNGKSPKPAVENGFVFEIFPFGLHQRPTKGGRNASRDSETRSGILTKFRNSLLREFEQELDHPTVCACRGWMWWEETARGESHMGPFAFENVTRGPNGLLDSPFGLSPSAACWDGCLIIRCRRSCVLYPVKRMTFPANIKPRPTPCQTEHQKRSFASNDYFASLLRFTQIAFLPSLATYQDAHRPPQPCSQQPSSSLSLSSSSPTQHPKAPPSQTAPHPSQPPNSDPATPLNAWP